MALKYKIFFIVFSVLLIFSNGFSQVYQEWIRHYSSIGNKTDYAIRVVTDRNNNVYVTGNTANDTTTFGDNVDIVTIKYNSTGEVKWTAKYRAEAIYSSVNRSNDIITDNNGNIYVTGMEAKDYGTQYIILIKYDSLGTMRWIRKYTGHGYDVTANAAFRIALDKEGNILIAGTSVEEGYKQTFITLKFSPAAELLWYDSYIVPRKYNSNDIIRGLCVDSLCNVYVVGHFDSSRDESDFCTIKYDKLGYRKWVSIYKRQGDDYPTNIAVDKNLNVYVSGSFGSMSRMGTIKYDSNGVFQWARDYQGSGCCYCQGYDLKVDSKNNVIITGFADNSNTARDIVTIKYNPDGNVIWLRIYDDGVNDFDVGYEMALDKYDNIYIAGLSIKPYTDANMVVVKYDSTGTEKWSRIYNGTANNADEAFSITLDNNGSVIIAGYSSETGTGEDFCIIKYSLLTGISDPINNEIKNIASLRNYPNPFNLSTIIEYSILRDSYIEITLYDVSGKEMQIIYKGNINKGIHKLTLSSKNLSSGIYFCKLTVNGKSTSIHRLIVIK
ncbi:MAG: SBBP repeat-containing protein [Ignavibacteria bacterium]